jgi:hypothetical protein
MEKMFVVVSLMMKGKWSKGVTGMKTNIAVLAFLICIVMVTTAVKAADVNLPTNGDFSGGTWIGRGGHVMPLLWDNANNRLDGGWGAPATEDYNTGGYVVAEVNGLGTTLPPGGYAVVFQASTMSLAAVGIPETALPVSDFALSADINDLIPGGGGPGAILKLESYSDLGGTTLITAVEQQITVSGSTWANYRAPSPFEIPLTTKSLKFVFGVSTGWGGPNTKISRFGFDNLRVGFYYPDTTPALFPVPIIGGAQNLPNKVISWSNPQGAVNADVYMLELTSPADYGVNPRTEGTLIAHDTNAQSLTVSSLQVNRYYYWMVDVNMGSSVVGGFIWDFHTTNLNVEAGPNQYLVRTASPKTLILNATVTSDNAIATYAWTNITAAGDKDPYTTVTIVSPTTEDTNVTLTNTEPNHTVDGWYQFTLTVTDVQGNIAADTVNVGVYATCAAAAIADPNDNYDGVGDFNGDCKVDFYDFAIFAGKWLACDSLRRPCP